MNKKVLVTFAVILALTGCAKKDEAKSPSPSEPHSSSSQKNPAEDNQQNQQDYTNNMENIDDGFATPTFDNLSSKLYGWGQGKNVDEKNRPTSCLEYNEKFGKYNAKFIAEDEKNIMLTFDEGYENGYTGKILDTLKEKDVKAIFYVTYDYANRNKELVQRIIDEGHILGNHGYGHYSMPTLTIEKSKQEIIKLHEYIKQEFNYEMTSFRPPKGEYSERDLAIVQSLGYETVFWSFAYKDWDEKQSVGKDVALDKMVKSAHNGAIYLLHAVSKDNSEVLGDFIDNMKTEGYTFNLK